MRVLIDNAPPENVTIYFNFVQCPKVHLIQNTSKRMDYIFTNITCYVMLIACFFSKCGLSTFGNVETIKQCVALIVHELLNVFYITSFQIYHLYTRIHKSSIVLVDKALHFAVSQKVSLL